MPSATKRPPITKPITPAALRRRHCEQRDPDRDEDRAEDEHRVAVPVHAACLAGRRDHHPARRPPHHAIDRRAEDAAATADEALPGRAEHDDLRPAPLGLADDLGRRAPASYESSHDPDAVRVADRDGLVELVVCDSLLVWKWGIQRQVERDLDDGERDHPRAPLRREPARQVEGVVGGTSGHDRNQDPAVGERERRAERRRGLDRLPERGPHPATAVERVPGQPGGHPAEPDPARQRILDDDHREREAGRDPAEHREQRPVDATEAQIRPGAIRDVRIGLRAQAHHRDVRDGERQRRSQRVQRAHEVDVSREQDRNGRDAGEEDQREVRGLEARMEPAEHLGHLPVRRHRVRDP